MAWCVLSRAALGIAQRVKTGGMHMRDTSRGHPLCFASARAQGQGQGQHEHEHEHSGRTGSCGEERRQVVQRCSAAVSSQD
jgi:hypothetical protein